MTLLASLRLLVDDSTINVSQQTRINHLYLLFSSYIYFSMRGADDGKCVFAGAVIRFDHRQFLERLNQKLLMDKRRSRPRAHHRQRFRGSSGHRHGHSGSPAGARPIAASGSNNASHQSLVLHQGSGSSPPPAGRHLPGPLMVQDAVREGASAWTRPLRDVRGRLKSLEASLDVECLSVIREHYVDVADPDTGIAYKAPPTLEPPPGMRITDHHLFLDHYGNKKDDPDKTCDYVAVLSRARQRLGRLLPPGRGARPKDFYDHYDDAMGGMFARWPRSLLCAAPNNDFELVGRLNASRLWLEMANPPTSQTEARGTFLRR